MDIAADIEKSLVDKGVTNYKNLVSITTIQELISRVSTLDLLITGDSGSMHIADLSKGMLGANGIVGGGPPLVCGAALTYKTKKSNTDKRYA